MVNPGRKIHLWLIFIVLNAILSFCLKDLLFFCLKTVCGLDFIEVGYFSEYLKWLMTRPKEPRKFHSQTAIKFTSLTKVLKKIIFYICNAIIDLGVSFCLIFFFNPGRNIQLWLIFIVLNVILSFCLVDFLSFCLKSVCGFDFIEFGYLFEYLKWLMTRTKELRKNDLQTLTNVIPPELSRRDVIDHVCLYVFYYFVVKSFALFDIFGLFSICGLMNCA